LLKAHDRSEAAGRKLSDDVSRDIRRKNGHPLPGDEPERLPRRRIHKNRSHEGAIRKVRRASTAIENTKSLSKASCEEAIDFGSDDPISASDICVIPKSLRPPQVEASFFPKFDEILFLY